MPNILLQQLENALPKGMQIPEELRQLYQWIEDNGYYQDRDGVRYKEATQKIVNEYSPKIDLRPISNNQVITVLGDEIKTLEKPKRATKK